MRTFFIVIAILAMVLMGGAGYLYKAVHTLEVEKITDDLHVIFGMGGNVAVLRTGAGAIIVDTMTFTSQGQHILEKAEMLAAEKVVMIINSHYHADHTHGNPAFEAGTRVVSTERTLWHLQSDDAEYFADTPDLLPNETFDTETHRISVGNKNLTLLNPGRGHTDGDLVVLFEEEKVVHMGDLYFNQHYPNIDLEAGGSIRQWPMTIDTVINSLRFEQVIPGHGSVSSIDGLRQFQSFIAQLGEIGVNAANQNQDLEMTIATDALTEDEGYEEITMIVPIGLSREFVLQRSWEEATGNFELRQ